MRALEGIAINAGLGVCYLAYATTLPGLIDTISAFVCASLCVVASWMFIDESKRARRVEISH